MQDNLTAQINLDLEVLNLLTFNAGVGMLKVHRTSRSKLILSDLSIDAVKLTIQNVTAKVLLEARLENIVNMVDVRTSTTQIFHRIRRF